MEILVLLTVHGVTIKNPLSTMKSLIGVEKEEPIEILVLLTVHCVTIKRPLSTMRNIENSNRNW